MYDTRHDDSKKIKNAYEQVERDLACVGKLLRTTEAGKYGWSSSHKSAITGLKSIIEKLRDDVPDYKVRADTPKAAEAYSTKTSEAVGWTK